VKNSFIATGRVFEAPQASFIDLPVVKRGSN